MVTRTNRILVNPVNNRVDKLDVLALIAAARRQWEREFTALCALALL